MVSAFSTDAALPMFMASLMLATVTFASLHRFLQPGTHRSMWGGGGHPMRAEILLHRNEYATRSYV